MTPREYLSYSQLALLERSPEKYVEQYIRGGKGYENGAMRFGSKIASALEHDEDTGDMLSDVILAHLPKLARRDEILAAEIGKGKHKVPVIAKPDSASEDWLDVIEYKTGKNQWTQYKVDKADQLTFYAMVIWIKTGKIPALRLIWAQTTVSGSHTQFTGKISTFHTTRHMTEILRMMERSKNAWAQIKDLVTRELL